MPWKKPILSRLAVLLTALPFLAACNDLSSPRTSEPPWANVELHDVVYANGQYVAVGGCCDPVVLTSPDGKSWTRRGLPKEANRGLRGVTYGGGQFVAVGSYSAVYPATILTSPDGIRWRVQDSGVYEEIGAVAYGNGKYVAVGGFGLILTSLDGVRWSVQPRKTWGHLHDILFANNTFIAVGNDAILTSSDGERWTVISKEQYGDVYGLSAVAYGNGRYVAVNWTSPNRFVISTDGVNWTAYPNTDSQDEAFWGLTFGAGWFMAVGEKGVVALSEDGITWQKQRPVSNKLRGATYGDRFVVVGFGTILITQ
ncbi:MAG: hypothetical protein P3W93_003665 [Thermus sp.]|nr:hypothetical protein [Thermus sp.]